jgi:CRISPR-associated protein Cas2
MKRKGWYLVTYDIANHKRLAKVHRVLKKEGIPAQKSVFFVFATEKQVNDILDRVAKEMRLSEDDLRAYPVTQPENVWTNKTNPLSEFPILHVGS